MVYCKLNINNLMNKNKAVGVILVLFCAIGFLFELFSGDLTKIGCLDGSKSKFLNYFIYLMLLIIGIKMMRKASR